MTFNDEPNTKYYKSKNAGNLARDYKAQKVINRGGYQFDVWYYGLIDDMGGEIDDDCVEVDAIFIFAGNLTARISYRDTDHISQLIDCQAWEKLKYFDKFGQQRDFEVPKEIGYVMWDYPSLGLTKKGRFIKDDFIASYTTLIKYFAKKTVCNKDKYPEIILLAEDGFGTGLTFSVAENLLKENFQGLPGIWVRDGHMRWDKMKDDVPQKLHESYLWFNPVKSARVLLRYKLPVVFMADSSGYTYEAYQKLKAESVTGTGRESPNNEYLKRDVSTHYDDDSFRGVFVSSQICYESMQGVS